MKLAAAKAYYFAKRGSLEVGDLEEQAATNDSDELAYAAGELLLESSFQVSIFHLTPRHRRSSRIWH